MLCSWSFERYGPCVVDRAWSAREASECGDSVGTLGQKQYESYEFCVVTNRLKALSLLPQHDVRPISANHALAADGVTHLLQPHAATILLVLVAEVLEDVRIRLQ
jgi:hypothetical protein